MAVFTSGAVLSDAPGFHYHDHAHDVFLVTKGFLKLYNGDKCRIMSPGDFAYVPPVCERIIEKNFFETYANSLVRKSFTCPT